MANSDKYRAVPGGKSPQCESYLKAINQSGNRDVCQTPLLFKELVSDAMMPFESSGIGGGGRQGGRA